VKCENSVKNLRGPSEDPSRPSRHNQTIVRAILLCPGLPTAVRPTFSCLRLQTAKSITRHDIDIDINNLRHQQPATSTTYVCAIGMSAACANASAIRVGVQRVPRRRVCSLCQCQCHKDRCATCTSAIRVGIQRVPRRRVCSLSQCQCHEAREYNKKHTRELIREAIFFASLASQRIQ